MAHQIVFKSTNDDKISDCDEVIYLLRIVLWVSVGLILHTYIVKSEI